MKRVIAGVALFYLLAVMGCATPVAPRPITLKWELQEGSQYTYDYTREITRKISTGGAVVSRTDTKKTKETGTVSVVGGKNMARACVSLKSTQRPTPGSKKETIRTIAAEYPLSLDGTALVSPGSPPLRDDLLLPFPARPLVPGEILRQEMVCMTPGWPMADGTGEFSYVGRETVDGVPCVQYRVSCNLRNEPKPGKKPEATVEIKADINALFTLGTGHLVSAEGIIHKRLSRPVKGLSKKEMGTSSITEETQKVSLRLR
ncbi:MAG: hypothetical protein GXP25_08655 [Planctomycetes bacterium]|nr:hypothetical protein [Planctomycetota bacterium]